MAPKVLIVMSDYGHDPTETAVPFQSFAAAGFEISFATESGKSPACDEKMLSGWTGAVLGAESGAKKAYKSMLDSNPIKSPLSWTSADFSFEPYNLLFFPGGHERSVRQVLDSPVVRGHLAAYWPQIRKDKAASRAVAAVCHGVLVLAETKEGDAPDGKGADGAKSILHDVSTTTLPGAFESGVWWATRAVLGDYYKTYGAGSANCEEQVKSKLDDPAKQFKGSVKPGPFVVDDEKYNYISARYPADAQLLADKVVALLNSFNL